VAAYAVTSQILMEDAKFKYVTLARNYMCSLMMIRDVLSKYLGEVKVI